MSFGIIASVGFGASAGTAAAIGTAGATIGSSLINRSAQKKATKAQVEGSDAANQLIREQFQETKAQLTPFITGASGAFNLQQAQSGALGPEAQAESFQNFNESPGVAFLRERGLRAIDRNAARPGGGGVTSGNTDKARIQFSQGLAQQDFGNQFNRLGAITGTGLSAAQALAGVGSQAASGQAANTQFAGQAIAQGQQNQGKILSSGISDLSSIYNLNKQGLFQ